MYRPKEEDRLLTTKEVAAFLGCCPNKLERGRCYGYGPPFFKLNRQVRYRLGDLIDYRDANKVDPRDRPE